MWWPTWRSGGRGPTTTPTKSIQPTCRSICVGGMRRQTGANIQNPVRTYGVIHFMNEAHRVLKPGGYLKARIPTTQSKAWAQDPTHVSFWNENTFLYFTHPGYRGLYPHLITAKFEAVKVDTIMPNQYGESWVKAILRKPVE